MMRKDSSEKSKLAEHITKKNNNMKLSLCKWMVKQRLGGIIRWEVMESHDFPRSEGSRFIKKFFAPESVIINSNRDKDKPCKIL